MAGHTAGVGVLDNGDARGIKLCHQLKGGIGIVDVVIAQRLALYLGCAQHPRALIAAAHGIERGVLMAVLTITENFFQPATDGKFLG